MRQFLHNSTHLLFRRQTHILSAALIIMITFALSHIMGLIKTRLLISNFFGNSAPLLDVYYAAFALPDTIFQLLVIGSLSAAFIPVFTKYLARDEATAWHVASSSLNIVLVIFSALSVVMFIFAEPLAKFIGPGFDPYQTSLLSHLLKVMLVAQFFFCISGFLTAMIQSHQRFIVPALSPIVYNLGIIFGILALSPFLGIYGPAVGAVIGAAAHMAIQLPLAFKLGFRPKPVLDTSHPGVREIVRLMPPRALALGVDQIEQLVAVILASTLAAGSLSLLNIARLLYAIPASLFGVTIGQAALPTLSRQSAQEDRRAFSQTFLDAFQQILFLALPLSILFIVLRIPIVRLVFGAKSFPWIATQITGKTLAILSVSATFAAAMHFVSRGFYALHDTRTPLKVGLVAAVLSSTAAFIAITYLNMDILALATVISATSIIESSVLFYLLSKRLSFDTPFSRHFLYKVIIPIAKMVITTIITGICLWVPMRLLDQFVFDTTRTLPLIGLTIVTSLIGLTVYLFLSYLFKVDELATFLTLLKRAKNWRKLLVAPKSSETLIAPTEDQS